MDLWNSTAFTRRSFLRNGLVLASAAATVPAFLQRSAYALAAPAGLSSTPGSPDERILVVVQLAGGNDGLNSVVPFMDPAYYKARPAIGISEKSVLRLGKNGSGAAGTIGLHPQLTGFKQMYDDGMMTLVQGVGYPNPNRSHFKSMDIWHTGEPTATGNGWLGRYFDNECCGAPKGSRGDAAAGAAQRTPEPMAGISLGREVPLAMQGQFSKPIGFETPDLFRWLGKDIDPALAERYEAINRAGATGDIDPNSNASFLMRTALDAQISSDLIRKAVTQKSGASYPANDLGRQMAMVGAMIKAGLKTRVYYVTLGGFDTHAGQGGEQGRHSQLMNQLGSSVRAFYDDLKKQGNAERVLTLSFSEFGRRVAQNASGGTDHGAAAPTFLFGPMVKPGVLGNHPSLTDLDEGDLRYQTDFRQIYSAILENWFRADSRAVLDGVFRPAQILKA